MLQNTCTSCRGRLVGRVCERCGRRWIPGAELPTPPTEDEEIKRPLTRANMTNAQRMAMAGGSSGRIDAISNAERIEQPATEASVAAANVSNAQRMARAGGSGHVDAVSNIERLEIAGGQAKPREPAKPVIVSESSDAISNKDRRQASLDAGGTEDAPITRKVSPPDIVPQDDGKTTPPDPDRFTDADNKEPEREPLDKEARIQLLVEASKSGEVAKQVTAMIKSGEFAEPTEEEVAAANTILEGDKKADKPGGGKSAPHRGQK